MARRGDNMVNGPIIIKMLNFFRDRMRSTIGNNTFRNSIPSKCRLNTQSFVWRQLNSSRRLKKIGEIMNVITHGLL